MNANALRDRITELAVIWDRESLEPAEDFANAVMALVADADPTDLGLELVGAISHPGGQIIHRAHDDAPAGPANKACVRCGCLPVYAHPRTGGEP